MRSIFFKSSSPSRAIIPPPTQSRSFSESLMDENIDLAESLITEWDSDVSSYCKIISLFHGDRTEAKQYLRSVRDLQSAMQFLVTQDSASDQLVRAQNLMQMAVKRLEKEFYQILSDNREYLDTESVSVSTRSTRSSAARSSVSDLEDDESDEEFLVAGESISGVEIISTVAMADLKAIADCMISSGYAKECMKIYTIVRKSIIDKALYHLGVERLNLSQVQKMDWEVLELKIRSWLNAVKIAVKTLFYRERILCDSVFPGSFPIAESCFAEISGESGMILFGFPELVAKCKKSPEKMFRTLDLYEAISDHWSEIEYIFSFESTSAVRTQAINSQIKLGEAVRGMLTDFEMAIQKDSSKTAVPGGGVHPLTRYVMNYISFLADYSGILADIVADWPLVLQSPLPESYFGSLESDNSPITVRIAWLILVLLCKLDGKAELHNDVALSYLFLANNLQYVVVKVRTSNLNLLLGDEWVTNHESKVKQYASNYERMGWSKVFASLPENPTAEIPPEQAKDSFKKFNAAFEETYRKQKAWIVPDPKLRDEIKVSVAKKLVSAYNDFFERNRVGSESFVRYTPDDLGNYLSDLLYGSGGGGSVSSSSMSCFWPRRQGR
ncbi:exocyst complex component EXO70H1-like [Juglans microcarpa x Juglans regia]|uniref:exocyst complex component EXO70H1-like n=1 Tax=Juglans microcarpa x Juglans regia TaxID=2249226 RepID=UPI001B7F53BE|nr:exocyst complex component EXO70H1-like [Juglans microcarpa x Juglans regia]XP_040992761.1 exocyst complex component EXO70H1-like [Juglans microcarpa x Juglans regia]